MRSRIVALTAMLLTPCAAISMARASERESTNVDQAPLGFKEPFRFRRGWAPARPQIGSPWALRTPQTGTPQESPTPIAAVDIARTPPPTPRNEHGRLLNTNGTSGRREKGFTGDNAGACLRFMHIPKTGGTTIDNTNFHLEKRAFGSLMANTYDRIGASMGLDWEEEGALYEKTHQDLDQYIPFVAAHYFQYRWVRVKRMTMCQDLHTPPHLSAAVGKYYKNSCGTFCVVRNPIDRYLSGYKMHTIGPCTKEGFEEAAEAHLRSLENNAFSIDCHFAPQVMFVYGAKTKEKSTYQYCNHILKTETLNEDFNALMTEYNRSDVTISPTRMFDHEDCFLSKDVISPAIKQAIYEFYRQDFEAFGYPKPA